jgi:hypothetical protein
MATDEQDADGNPVAIPSQGIGFPSRFALLFLVLRHSRILHPSRRQSIDRHRKQEASRVESWYDGMCGAPVTFVTTRRENVLSHAHR